MPGRNTSAAGLKAIEIIQNNGKMVVNPRTSATSIQTILTTSPCLRLVARPIASVLSLIGEAPAPRQEEEEARHQQQDNDKDRGDRRGVAERTELEGLLVDVDDKDLRGV